MHCACVYKLTPLREQWGNNQCYLCSSQLVIDRTLKSACVSSALQHLVCKQFKFWISHAQKSLLRSAVVFFLGDGNISIVRFWHSSAWENLTIWPKFKLASSCHAVIHIHYFPDKPSKGLFCQHSSTHTSCKQEITSPSGWAVKNTVAQAGCITWLFLVCKGLAWGKYTAISGTSSYTHAGTGWMCAYISCKCQQLLILNIKQTGQLSSEVYRHLKTHAFQFFSAGKSGSQQV